MACTSVRSRRLWSRSAGVRLALVLLSVVFTASTRRRGAGDAGQLSRREATLLQLSRRALPFLLVVPGLAFAAPAAQALPPVVTLTSPVGHQAVNPPSFAGT